MIRLISVESWKLFDAWSSQEKTITTKTWSWFNHFDLWLRDKMVLDAGAILENEK